MNCATFLRSYGRIFLVKKILFLSLFYPFLVSSDVIYIKSDDIYYYNDNSRSLTEQNCTRFPHITYRGRKTNGLVLIKIDMNEKTLKIAAAKLDSENNYLHTTIWNLPAKKNTTSKFNSDENKVEMREYVESSYPFWKHSFFEISRNTLEGQFRTSFDQGICSNVSMSSDASIEWRQAELISAEEFSYLIGEIKERDNIITKVFKEKQKEIKKF